MAIPTVDLSPFFFTDNNDDDHENKKKNAKEIIKEACSQYGFFQIANHGVPLETMSRAIQLSKAFFALSDEEKLKYGPRSGAPLPAGYSKQPDLSPDMNEYLLMFQPHSGFNVLPANPSGYRDVLEEIFTYFRKTGELMEEILNECLGFPPNFFKEYNHDRSWDFMVALRYSPATETENNIGITEHEDGNCFTFVIQDEVGGLEVKKDGKWIPVVPTQGTIVVNIGDVIQVLSNNKFKSTTHRVVRKNEKSRHSFAFFYTIEGDKWVEPLPQFTQELGEAPHYMRFLYKDYQAMRMRNKTHPPSRPEDAITINHYAISKKI